jgi:hypothetical protein
MTKPITRCAATFAFLVIVLEHMHDFIMGEYQGPLWLAPFDFVLSLAWLFYVGWMLVLAVKYQEEKE